MACSMWQRGLYLACWGIPALLIYLAVAQCTAGSACLHWADSVRGLWPLPAPAAAALGALLAAILLVRPRPVYLLDFECWKPPESMRVSKAKLLSLLAASKKLSPESLEFCEKVAAASGLGDETAIAEYMHAPRDRVPLEDVLRLAEAVLFPCVEGALAKAGVAARDVDVLVVNCSAFAPFPSLSAMIVNHFRMRADVASYNLSGMGCSAGVIAVGLAADALQVGRRRTALVVSTEIIDQTLYFGDDRSFLIPNCLFRQGGAAVVLSSSWAHRWRAKYQLLHVVRTHMGADDRFFGCVRQGDDSKGQPGIHLDRSLMTIAGRALQANLMRLAPRVLPLWELALVLANLVERKVLKRKVPPYVPDFGAAFEHFCLHSGGRGVLDAVERELRLPAEAVAPSRAALQRFGNTSAASIWYVLSNIEALGAQGVRRGHRIWQLGFGSGFKCNSAVWRALRPIRGAPHAAWQPDEAGDSAKQG